MTIEQIKRIRWAVRAALVLGVAASVVANVLHANPNPISQGIAAWPPLALLITVELISRVPVHRRSLAYVRLSATVVISGIAAWVSYWHMAGVAARYGETGAAPYLIPLSVDGLIVVASVCLVELADKLREMVAQRAAAELAERQQRAAELAERQRVAAEQRAADRAKVERERARAERATPAPAASRARGRGPARGRTPGQPQKIDLMRAFWDEQRAAGHIPSLAECDRAAGTNGMAKKYVPAWKAAEAAAAETATDAAQLRELVDTTEGGQ